ncbi:MAG: ComEC/Rec2 family competence protein [bacterium]
MFVAGIIAATYASLPGLLLLGLILVAAAAAIICRLVERPLLSRLLLGLALLASGCFAAELVTSELPVNHISHFTGFDDPVELVGEVFSEPDMRATNTFLTVAVDSITYQNRTIATCGKIRLRIGEPTMRFNYRDRIRFSGFLNEPYAGRNPGAFDYRRYLLIRGIHGLVNLPSVERVTLIRSGSSDPFIRNLIKPLREYIIGAFDHFLPTRSAAVMRGFLIGDVRMIPADVYQRFKDTGTLHVLAASGANVAYVMAALFFLVKPFRLPRRFRLLLALVGVVIFSFLAYNQPSVVRASVMASIALLGKLLYRDVDPLNVISFAALVILAFEPLYLFDLGFQLSFAAAYGLVLAMPEIDRRLPKSKSLLPRLLRYAFFLLACTVVAQLAVSPILLYAFHQVPLVSFVSNLLVVPLVGVATTLGIVLVLLSGIPHLSELVAAFLTLTLKSTLAAIDFFALVPVARIRLAIPSFPEVALYYAALLTLLSWWKRSKLTAVFLLIAFVSLNLLVWGAVFGDRDRLATITILDTWDANTAYVETADGHTTLINGGEAFASFDRGQSVVVPFLLAQGTQQLDRVVATNNRPENLQSLRSVFAGLAPAWQTEVDTSIPIREVAPQTLLQFDSLKVLLLFDYSSVQSLNNLPGRADLIACDWAFLVNGDLAILSERLNCNKIILSSYPNRYQSVDLLEESRAARPDISLWSTLESGGIVLNLRHSPMRVEIETSD